MKTTIFFKNAFLGIAIALFIPYVAQASEKALAAGGVQTLHIPHINITQASNPDSNHSQSNRNATGQAPATGATHASAAPNLPLPRQTSSPRPETHAAAAVAASSMGQNSHATAFPRPKFRTTNKDENAEYRAEQLRLSRKFSVPSAVAQFNRGSLVSNNGSKAGNSNSDLRQQTQLDQAFGPLSSGTIGNAINQAVGAAVAAVGAHKNVHIQNLTVHVIHGPGVQDDAVHAAAASSSAHYRQPDATGSAGMPSSTDIEEVNLGTGTQGGQPNQQIQAWQNRAVTQQQRFPTRVYGTATGTTTTHVVAVAPTTPVIAAAATPTPAAQQPGCCRRIFCCLPKRTN